LHGVLHSFISPQNGSKKTEQKQDLTKQNKDPFAPKKRKFGAHFIAFATGAENHRAAKPAVSTVFNFTAIIHTVCNRRTDGRLNAENALH